MKGKFRPWKKKKTKKYNKFKLENLNENWVNSLPKTINENGCWISFYRPNTDGYIQITIENNVFTLHRLVNCIFNNLKYTDITFESRHAEGCIKACFNPTHLKVGTHKDNMRDILKHYNTMKENCPKCGCCYRKYTIKTGWNRGKTQRICDNCRSNNAKIWKRKLEISHTHYAAFEKAKF